MSRLLSRAGGRGALTAEQTDMIGCTTRQRQGLLSDIRVRPVSCGSRTLTKDFVPGEECIPASASIPRSSRRLS